MATIKVNECVDCGLPCLGDSCPKRNVSALVCDDCGDRFSADDLYEVEDGQYCKDGIFDHLAKVGDRL